ncbi:MAG: GTP-binding protein [Candidatus Liptonbacteria bacterium]|nr:GTP-binding protein [Candidatus Liptonbacteria bacterium]
MAKDINKTSSEGGPSSGGKTRQPIVVVMGHVDHGKTTLLDYIRKANVAGREAGGITQAIGAYEITHIPTNADHTQTDAEKIPRKSASSPRESVPSEGRKITFIDTPGHEAFSKMRARGANAADLAILVVAAEEGVKPQTKEVLKTLAETKTPFVVAINKIDKPGADIEKTKNDLMQAEVFLEGYGGQVSYETISAKTGEGVDKLLDLVLLVADTAEIKSDSFLPGKGYILETRRNKNRGLEVSVILSDGTLSEGDDVATATAKGKAKILENFLGEAIHSVLPGAPALIVGFEEMPKVGEEFFSGSEARSASLGQAALNLKNAVAKKNAIPSAHNDEVSLFLLLKASDAGSLEALSEIIRALPLFRPVKIIAESVGEVSEGDVKTAISVGAMIVAYKTKLDRSAKNMTETREIEMISSDIIYELVKAIELSAKEAEGGKVIGELEVLAVFNQSKLEKQVVGGKVVRGIFKNKGPIEIHRDGAKIGDGKITNLKAKKLDVISLPEGQEGGLMVGSAAAVLVGDHLIIREKKEEKI